MKISLMTKLILSFIIVVSITGGITIYIGRHFIIQKLLTRVQENVMTDLIYAREVYTKELNSICLIIRLTTENFFIKNYFLKGDIDELAIELENIRKKEKLDFLNLTDKSGKIIARARNPEIVGDDQSKDELVNYVLSKKESIASTVIVSRDELLKEGEELANQAYIKYIPTVKAKPTKKVEETSGMVLKSAAPIIDHEGELLGVLYGGTLLNRNFEIVDKVKQVVYNGLKYKGKEMGTVTIFQNDLRISTNVKTEYGERAIGTRISEEVYNKVLLQGQRWTDRAFVVKDWYISVYEPIKNLLTGEIIGILYVGVLEDKFVDEQRNTILIFIGVAFAGMGLAVIVSYLLSRSITKPIRRLLIATQKVAQGELGYQVTPQGSKETQELTQAFNLMSLSLKESNEKLKQKTEEQLMRSEKLATIGQLAAGVAHEINNPLGSALLYSELVLSDMEETNLENILIKENMEKLKKNISRCQTIVKGLLDFARQTEPELVEYNINELIEKTLFLLESQPLFHEIKIVKNLSSVPPVKIDKSQIQQVLTNIIINAAEAMGEKGGTLTINSLVSPDNKVEVNITDTGCGISEENLKKIFDPFFTTKEKGTGLGLSICYGIIEKHNGEITVKSKVGEGTTFIIKLPIT